MLRMKRVRFRVAGQLVALAAGLLLVPSRAAAQFPIPMPPEKTVLLLGQSVHYFEAGQGPNVIFLHGLGGDATNWAANIPAVSEKYHVYALDQIGFGHSDKPLIEYKIETFVEFLHAFMQALKIPKATLVGNSLGGWISLEFAARHAEMVEELVLVDAAGLSPEGGVLRLPIDLNPGSLEATRKILEFIVYDKQLVTDEFVRLAFERRMKSGDGYTIQRVMAGIFSGNQYEDQKVASIHAPTLIVWGRDDLLTPLSIGERLQKAIAGSRVVVFDQCGHIPQIEKPAEFNSALLRFLAQP